ncbi:MAG: ABC transporter ATP-binding protein [Desulfobacterales bacterium]|nr:ABC transporter ATP-binding protein [Desulfobacterales bacterium]
MIQFNAICYRYPTTQWVLKGIDLSIDKGEYIVVCGTNGSGKSTFGYLFNGLIPHFFGGTLKGSVRVNNADIKDKRASDFLSTVGLVLQNPDAQLFNNTVENEIAYGLESLGKPSEEIDKRIYEIARTLQIENLLNRTPMELSGGEKRMVAIASVLCLDPSVLVLDEPYANLDWEGIRRLREVLRQIHQSGKNIVVIEQLMDCFLEDTTRCIIAKQGKIVFDGPSQAALNVLLKEHLLPQYPPRRNHRSPGKDTILEVRNLSCRIGNQPIFKNVSFEVKTGEIVAIIGKNGSGKTTLIKHLNGLMLPTGGEIFFKGKTILGRSPAEMAADIGLSFQNANDQFFKSSVKDELLVGPKQLGKKQDKWFKEVCDLFELHSLLDKSPYLLSEGEKKRVAISSVMVMQPKLIVLDEPTVGQDGHFREALARVLTILQDRGCTILIVTHDLDFAHATADRWLLLRDGNVVTDGSPLSFYNDIIYSKSDPYLN